MIFKFEKSILLLVVIVLFFSCKAQENQAIGEIANQLDDEIWQIFQDTKSNYWFGSNEAGVYHLNGKVLRQYSTEDGLIDNTIRGIQEDQNGNVFIETPLGVSRFDGENFTSLEIVNGQANDWKLLEEDLWFNCNANAKDVYRYDGSKLIELKLPRQDLTHTFERFEKPMNYSPYTVFGIDKDKEGNIWFGTILAGAFRFDGERFLWVGEKELSRLEDGREPGVRSMLEDKNGFMWLSNFMSKYKIKPGSVPVFEKELAAENAKELLGDRIGYFNSGLTANDGNLWMTTYGGGVWKYDGEKLFNYPIEKAGETVYLMSIYEDRKGVLWLATQNDGAYKYDGEKFVKFELQ